MKRPKSDEIVEIEELETNDDYDEEVVDMDIFENGEIAEDK